MGLQKDSIFSYGFYPVGFAVCGVAVPILQNIHLKRPLYTGIQRHIAFGSIGFLLGVLANRHFEKKWAKRDAIIKHYIELHPEDFVEDRKKYKEIFEEWYPVR